MKRLTYMCGGKWRLRIGDTEYSGKVVDRLAAYEGTGLEPEEIYAVKVVGARIVNIIISQDWAGVVFTWTEKTQMIFAAGEKKG